MATLTGFLHQTAHDPIWEKVLIVAGVILYVMYLFRSRNT